MQSHAALLVLAVILRDCSQRSALTVSHLDSDHIHIHFQIQNLKQEFPYNICEITQFLFSEYTCMISKSIHIQIIAYLTKLFSCSYHKM